MKLKEIDIEIMAIVEDYFEKRGLTQPDAEDALHFLVSEVGELADAFVNKKNDWVRNNEKERSVDYETGDVLMMLYVFCMKSGIFPTVAMKNKMAMKLSDKV